MNSIRQHRPGYFVGFEEATAQFDSLDRLSKIPWVRAWEQEPSFDHWALSGGHLMAIMDGGAKWYVVGTIAAPSLVDLPEWCGGKPSAAMTSREFEEIRKYLLVFQRDACPQKKYLRCGDTDGPRHVKALLAEVDRLQAKVAELERDAAAVDCVHDHFRGDGDATVRVPPRRP